MTYPFFAFEGIDGAGKSTQLKKLIAYLKAHNYPVFETLEPTKAPIGCLLREGLSGKQPFSEETLALLFAADRVEHIKEINEKIKDAIVLTDRYLMSSIAYNSTHLSSAWIKTINAYATLKPTRTLLFDLPVDTALARINRRMGSEEIFENKARLEKVRASYLKEAKNNDAIIILDATKPEADLFDDLLAIVLPLI